MTFTLGRNQIHIGFKEALAVIVAVVSGTWCCSAVINSFNAKQDKILKQQTEMLATLKSKDRKDSLQDYRIDTMATHIFKSDYAQRDIRDGLTVLQDHSSTSSKYVTETRDRNGKIKEHPYRNN